MFSPAIFTAAFLLSTFATSSPVAVRQAEAYQIRGVSDPIYHLYLQAQADDPSVPVLGAEASGDTFYITDTIQSAGTGLYLNIVPDDSVSYKTLVFEETSTTTAWGLEGDTIITTTGSEYGRQLNFVVCEATAGQFKLFLQTGADVPEGTCSNFLTIHLPCLC
ncbi:hypothetical protein FQN55_006065 [Onygenales sp. PD_40]|nr:hypothetical protein FQN55_006065 [Onygenales sp. PD_40]